MSHVTLAYHESAAAEADALSAHLRAHGYAPAALVCDAGDGPLATRLLATEGPLLLFVNDELLHSRHCQLGLLDAFPRLQQREGFHPVMASTIRRGGGTATARVLTSLSRVSDVIRYMNYWQHAYLTRRRELGSAAGTTGAEELAEIRRISQEIGDVLRLIRAEHPSDVRALAEADAETLHRLLGPPHPPPTDQEPARHADDVTLLPTEDPAAPDDPEAGDHTETDPAAPEPLDEAEPETGIVTRDTETDPERVIVAGTPTALGVTGAAALDLPTAEAEESSASPTSPPGGEGAEPDPGIPAPSDGETRQTPTPVDSAAVAAEAENDIPRPDDGPTDELPHGDTAAHLDEGALRKLRSKARKLTRARNLQTFLAHRDEQGVDAAADFARAALLEDPRDHRLRYAYAVTLLERAERDDEATDDLREAIQPLFEGPLAPQTHVALGQLSLRRRDFGAARRHFRRAFKLNRRVDPELSYWLGTLLQDEFDDERARAARYLRHAAKRSRRNRADANYRLGLIEYAAGRRRRAIRRLKLALRLEPGHPFAAYDLASVYLERNRPLRARAYFEEALRANPELDTPANQAAFTPVDADGAPTRLPETRADKFFGFVRERDGQPGDDTGAASTGPTAGLRPAVPPADVVAAGPGDATPSRPGGTSASETGPEAVTIAELSTDAEDAPRRRSRTVLITGASSGIGAATARRFARAGDRLILTGRRVEALLKLSAALKTEFGTPVRLLSYDVSDYPTAEQMVGSLADEWADVDVLVNNAGKARGLKPVHEMAPAEIDDMVDTNVKGLLYMTQLVGARMVARGSGHVINVCSTAGHEVYAGGTVYCATKHAVDAITRGSRLDLYTYGVRVSQVSPAAVEATEFSNVRFGGDVARAEGVYEGWQPLRPVDVAEEIFRIATAAAHVNVQDVILLGTQQANSTNIDRSGRARYAP